GSADKTIKSWNATDGKPLLNYPAQPAAVLSLAVSGDNKHFVAGLANNTAKEFDLTATDPAKAAGESLAGQGGPVLAVAVLPDKLTVLTASEDKTIRLWPRAAEGPQFTLSGHTGQVYSVAWSPDGKEIATAAADKSFRQWDAAKGSSTRTVAKAHENVVYSIV